MGLVYKAGVPGWLLLHRAAVLGTPVSGCSSGVKCRGSVSDPRAAFGFDFFLDVADLSRLPSNRTTSRG